MREELRYPKAGVFKRALITSTEGAEAYGGSCDIHDNLNLPATTTEDFVKQK